MSEKYKILRNAEKYVVAGKLGYAVKEYQKLLSNEPEEPTLLNTVGDLFLKQNNREEALNHFRRAADVYLRSGFLVKTIAVYKKIYQFDPNDPNVNESLADLYQKQGLTYEAGRHLKLLVEYYQKEENLEQATTCLQRLVQLNPTNPEIQLQLAELMEKRRDEAGAFEHYQAAASLFLQADNPERAFETARRALEIDPTDDRSVELYVNAAQKDGKSEIAQEMLVDLVQRTGQRLPYEIFLAQMMEAEGQVEAAHAKYLELEPLAYSDSRVREGLGRTTPLTPYSEESSELHTPALFHDPDEQIQEITIDESPDWMQGEDRPGAADIFSEKEDVAAAQPASSPLSFFDSAAAEPSLPEFSWQEPEAMEPEEEEEDAFESVDEDEPAVELEEAPIESLDEALQEADFYLKLGFREEAKKLLEKLLHTYPRDERVRRRAEKVMTIPPEFDSAAERVESVPAVKVESKRPTAKPSKLRSGPPPPVVPIQADAPPVAEVPSDSAFPSQEPVPFDLEAFERSLQGDVPAADLFGGEPVAETPPPAAEEVSFPSAQGDLPWEAKEEGGEFDLSIPGIGLDEPVEPAPEYSLEQGFAPEEPELPEIEAPVELQEAEEFALQQRFERVEQEEIAEPETEEPVAPEAPVIGFHAAGLIPLEELDEAPTARQELSEPEFDDEVDSALDSLFSGNGYDASAEEHEILRYDVSGSSGADEGNSPKVHYDLGLAYKEMGLVEDAVQEFQTAVQLLNDPMYNPHRILCCSMLANSLLQLGRYGEAINWAEEGLRIPGKKEFEWKALKYDWAGALERQGKHPEALEGFREILDRDPEYRDVLQRVDNLLRIS